MFVLGGQCVIQSAGPREGWKKSLVYKQPATAGSQLALQEGYEGLMPSVDIGNMVVYPMANTTNSRGEAVMTANK